MKQIILGILVLGLPLLAAAAISGGDIAITLPSLVEEFTIGAGSTFQNLDISSTAFTFTLSAGQTLTLRSPQRRKLDNSQGGTYSCSGTESVLSFNAASPTTLVVFPSGVCQTSTPTPTPPTPTPATPPTAASSGDINGDKIVNSIDWGLMNFSWLTNNSTSDLNSDGIVNSIDFSILNANWLKTF